MKKILILNLIFFIVLFNTTIFAKDYIVENNGEVEVVISGSNINRIKVFRDRIKDIRANLNELIINTDSTDGEIFIKPTLLKDSVDIFLKTENGFSYKLILKIKEIQAQQIFLNRADSLSIYSDSDILRREKLKLINENLYFDFSEKYEISAINLIRSMSSFAKLKEFNIVDRKGQQLLQYNDFKVDWLYSYIKNDKSGISGEIAKIINVSDKRIQLNESNFFRHGIRSVRLEKLELNPQESCYLYIVGGEQ